MATNDGGGGRIRRNPSLQSLGSATSRSPTVNSPSNDDFRRKNRRGLLKSYYGDNKEEQKSNRIDPLDVDGPDFDAEMYLKKTLIESNIKALMEKDQLFTSEIRSLDSDMQTLVYENYNKFIAATETIRQMKTKVAAMEDETKRLSASMEGIQGASTGINAVLDENRHALSQLSGVHMLLKKLQFLFELPARLSKCIDMEAYRQAVNYYTKATSILERYEHLPSFAGIRGDCQAMIDTLTATMNSRFTDPKASADQLAEAVELLICLKHDPEMLCDNYLNGMGVRLDRCVDGVGDRVEVAAATKGTTDTQSLDDFLDSCQNRFMVPVRETMEDFKRLFESNALLGDAQKEAVTGKFVAFIQDVLSRYLTAVTARFEVDIDTSDNDKFVDAVDKFFRQMTDLDGVYPPARASKQAVTVVRAVLSSRITHLLDGMRQTFAAYVNELSDAAKEKQSADEPILLAVYATAGEVLQRCVAENLQSLKPYVKEGIRFASSDSWRSTFLRKFVMEHLVYAFVKHVPEYCMAVSGCGSRPEPPGFSGPAAPLLVLALGKLCLDMETSTVHEITNLASQAFPQLKGQVPHAEIAQLMKTCKAGAQKLVNHYVALQGVSVATMVRKSVETRDWVTSTEPRMVRAVMKRVVEDVTSMEGSTALLFDDDANSARNSADSSRRPFNVMSRQNRFGMSMDANIMSNIQKLFTEQIEVFDDVDFSRSAIMTGIVKIFLKAFVESVRLRTLGKYGYQQIEVDVLYLKKHLWRIVPDTDLLNFFLEEIMQSAEGRSLDPVKMDPNVVEAICEK